MSRRVGLRLVPARAVDEEEGLAGGEAEQMLDDVEDRAGDPRPLNGLDQSDHVTARDVEEGGGRPQPPALGAPPAATPSR